MSGRVWVIWFRFSLESLSLPTFILLPLSLVYRRCLFMRLIIGFPCKQKCSVYSRPHFDGACVVCDSDNPIKVVHAFLLTWHVLIPEALCLSSFSRFSSIHGVICLPSFLRFFSILGAVRPHSRGSSHSMAFCSTFFFRMTMTYLIHLVLEWHLVPT